MIVWKNVHLLGTSHIASESIKQVKLGFETLGPDIIALELDPGRAYSIKHKTKRPKNMFLLKQLGLGGFLFYVIGEFLQKKLGKIVNIDPGAEMLAALDIAEKSGIPVALIDRDIQVTLRRFSAHFKKRELLRMIWDIISGVFKKNAVVNMELSKVPSEKVINIVLEHTKKRYPSLYRVLIQERDRHMALSLFHISSANPDKKIMAVVGAGHLRGMKKYLEEF
ncbi:TraB/GumN family protein [Candidatus Woesearchaeota archaeon]|nr:TraB/GumN family protein [Candidatus Woesearchaeota archaeon]